MKRASFHFEFDLEANCLFIKYSGTVTVESIRDLSVSVLNHPDHRKGLNRILDFRDCKISLPTNDLEALSENFHSTEGRRGQYREAIIVNSLLAYGLVREFNGLQKTRESDCRIFKSDNSEFISLLKKWSAVRDDYAFPKFMDL